MNVALIWSVVFSVKIKRLKFLLFCSQLNSTKSVDGQRNLLHFLAETVEDKYPDIAGFEMEMTHIEAASKGTLFTWWWC